MERLIETLQTSGKIGVFRNCQLFTCIAGGAARQRQASSPLQVMMIPAWPTVKAI